MLARAILFLGVAMLSTSGSAQTSSPPLVLEGKIPLGEISGRLDHLGIDLKRQRLFVAELGNDSLGVVDLAAGKTMRTITGLSEPQGVAYVLSTDNVYVANGGDGSVRLFGGDDLAPIGRVELGSDADNVRVDPQSSRVLVGYGKGALALIDPATRAKVADFRLKAHPEGFQIDETGTRVFVNVPNAREIDVIDLAAKANRSLSTQGAGSNFPMAVDRTGHRVLSVFRSPAILMTLSNPEGLVVAKVPTCGDADDVFVDAKRRRVYVSCGEGVVDVLDETASGYQQLSRVPTVSGARTSLFVPELDRLFVAVRARSGEPAAIWVFRPAP